MKSNKQSVSKPINKSSVVSEENFFVSVLSCIHRTNMRFFMNLPNRIKNFVIRSKYQFKIIITINYR